MAEGGNGDDRNWSILDKAFTDFLPALMGVSSFLPLFPALLDLPTLVLALENLQTSSGAAPGTTSGSKKSPAPEALLALMDEAYTGSIIADSQGDAANGGFLLTRTSSLRC